MIKITVLARNSFSLLLPLALLSPLLILTGCASITKTPGPALQRPGLSMPEGGVSSALRYALGLQGIPYRYGGDSPRAGFDCSGFVQHVYARHGIKLPRRSREMAVALQPVTLGQRCPGDLVFFHTGHPYSHVGIYLGQGRFIHTSSRARKRVTVSALGNPYWARRLAGFRRPWGLYLYASERGVAHCTPHPSSKGVHRPLRAVAKDRVRMPQVASRLTRY